MLLKRGILERIAEGSISLVFRRWRRPSVKTGGRLTTSIGIIAIDALDPVSAEEIGDADARRAGYASAAELRNELSGRPEGQLYRIAVRLVSADPRIALRADDRLGAEEIATLQTRLDRLDGAEPWTRRAMELVASEPGLRAADLAEAVGLDKPAFKARMRKLKALGLTESLDVGYRLSPRGRSLLKGLGDTERCS